MTGEFVLCHDCDLPNRVGNVPEGGSARCPRCDGLLRRSIPDTLDRTLAFTLGGMLLFVVANSFPFLSFDMQGRVAETTLMSGIEELWSEEMFSISGLVFVTAVLAPGRKVRTPQGSVLGNAQAR